MLSQNNNSPVNGNAGGNEDILGLIKRAKQGDSQAFGSLYAMYLTPLYRYVVSRSHDTHLAEDICQSAFLKFYEALPRYELVGSPLAYLFTIARRLLINHHEKFKAESYDDEFFEQEASGSDLLSEAHIKLLAEHIDSYVDQLKPLEAEVIRMVFYSELSHKEVADILGREEASIRQIKHRALLNLRELTKHLYAE